MPRKGLELEERTLQFAVRIVTFVSVLPRTDAAIVLGRQLLRAGTSIGANYREANRAESKEDFVHKVAIALKEAAETEYWLRLHARVSLGDAETLSVLATEAGELVAILSTIKRWCCRANP
jgi:four helix bundle protein